MADPRPLARRWLATEIAKDRHGPDACGCDHPEIVDACYAGEHDHDERLDGLLADAVDYLRKRGAFHGQRTHGTEVRRG